VVHECGEYGEYRALSWATDVGARSPCHKSRRGVVIWMPGEGHAVASGFNHQPRGFACDGSLACRKHCSDLCVHAEAAALASLTDARTGLHMLHVKSVEQGYVHSGGPSCVRCSKLILDDSRIAVMWLLHRDGLRKYTPEEFHRLTLERLQLPVITEAT
jgi:deoxycytidylate deaminase